MEDTLFHYCSTESFLSIMNSRKIRLSDLSQSNDSMEGKWAIDVFLMACEREEFPQYALEYIKERYQEYSGSSGGQMGLCLSENPDILSQWRGYADDGYGFCIGISKSYLSDLENPWVRTESNWIDGWLRHGVSHALYLKKVIYDQEEQILYAIEKNVKHVKTYINEKLEYIFENYINGSGKFGEYLYRDDEFIQFNSIIADWLIYRYHLKNPAFLEEKEWRLLGHHGNKFGGFKALRDKIVPYLEIPLERNQINSIYLGPKNATSEENINLFMGHDKRITVKRSLATYR